MPKRIVYAPVSFRDIADTLDYISQDNPEAATKVAKAIREAIGLLTEFPTMGRTFNEAGLAGTGFW